MTLSKSSISWAMHGDDLLNRDSLCFGFLISLLWKFDKLKYVNPYVIFSLGQGYFLSAESRERSPKERPDSREKNERESLKKMKYVR